MMTSLRLTNAREVILQEMAAMGFPLNEMTEEQIDLLVQDIEGLLTSSGFTEEQARYVLRELNPTSDR